jgi:hypothetical protein
MMSEDPAASSNVIAQAEKIVSAEYITQFKNDKEIIPLLW